MRAPPSSPPQLEPPRLEPRRLELATPPGSPSRSAHGTPSSVSSWADESGDHASPYVPPHQFGHRPLGGGRAKLTSSPGLVLGIILGLCVPVTAVASPDPAVCPIDGATTLGLAPPPPDPAICPIDGATTLGLAPPPPDPAICPIDGATTLGLAPPPPDPAICPIDGATSSGLVPPTPAPAVRPIDGATTGLTPSTFPANSTAALGLAPPAPDPAVRPIDGATALDLAPLATTAALVMVALTLLAREAMRRMRALVPRACRSHPCHHRRHVPRSLDAIVALAAVQSATASTPTAAAVAATAFAAFALALRAAIRAVRLRDDLQIVARFASATYCAAFIQHAWRERTRRPHQPNSITATCRPTGPCAMPSDETTTRQPHLFPPFLGRRLSLSCLGSSEVTDCRTGPATSAVAPELKLPHATSAKKRRAQLAAARRARQAAAEATEATARAAAAAKAAARAAVAPARTTPPPACGTRDADSGDSSDDGSDDGFDDADDRELRYRMILAAVDRECDRIRVERGLPPLGPTPVHTIPAPVGPTSREELVVLLPPAPAPLGSDADGALPAHPIASHTGDAPCHPLPADPG